MAETRHRYRLAIRWTGNLGSGTTGYRDYDRSHTVTLPGRPDKPPIDGSSDPAFRGDPDRWSPEELLVAALAQCHMLWFLHLAAVSGVVVVGYEDAPEGWMLEHADGTGEFTQVVLHPTVTVTDAAMLGRTDELHERAHESCFIARSVRFPVACEPSSSVAETG